jgi:lipopolysaccharide transport system ATP-binding protein
MSQIAIHVESLGKRYRIGGRMRYLTIRDRLANALKAPARWLSSDGAGSSDDGPRHIWALRNASFDLREGEVLGLIGRNGAGKTTLLKILSRVTLPTEGSAEIRGRVGSLLEVGTGFHPELTGRENTYLNGAILGMGKQEIKRKFDDIVAFAEVADFIDTPLKYYSSGMQTRLAFAVAAHFEPQIMLVDEVLAVGDISFQKKCLSKMGEVAHAGRTIVFVTHQMNQIRRLCEKVIWMDGGTIRQVGPTAEIVGAYEAAMTSGTAPSGADRGERVRFLSWEIAEPRSESPHMLTSLGPVTVRFVVQVDQRVWHGHHGIALYNMDRQMMWGWAKDDVGLEPGLHSFTYTFPMLPLRPGAYAWLVSLYEDGELLDAWDCLPEMNIATRVYQHPKDEWSGILNVPSEFSINQDNSCPGATLPASSVAVMASKRNPIPEPPVMVGPQEERGNFAQRIRRFAARPAHEKYASIVQRFHSIFPNVPVLCRLTFGAWWVVENSMIDSGLLWRGFETAELRFVENFLEPGMRVLDIGAHHGLYTLLASKRVGSCGEVIAFEPSPRERRLLARNLHLNPASNVRIENYALGHEASKAELFLVQGSEDGCNSLRPPAVAAATQTVLVDVISLDDYLLDAGLKRVDFVKLDVEGAERDVLLGASDLLSRSPRPVILVEVQDIRTRPWGYPALEIVQLLDRAGYEWFRILNSGLLTPTEIHEQNYDANLVAIPRDRVADVFRRLGGQLEAENCRKTG